MTDRAAPPPAPFCLGEWRIEPSLLQVTGPAGHRRVEPRVMDLLVLFASRPLELHTKQDLIATLWGGVAVTDNVLAQAVRALRRALDDDWRQPRFVETISKRGYRLLQTPQPIEGMDGPPAGRRLALGAAATIATAAVAAALWGPAIVPAPARVLRAVPATSLPGREIQPALSSQGDLAFAWADPEGGSWDVYVQPAGSSTPRRLTTAPAADRAPAWSPDGRELAYLSIDATSCAILRAMAGGGDPRRVASCHDPGAVDWSPDGEALVFDDRPPGESSRVRLVDLASGAGRAVTAPPVDWYGDMTPRFSPDGRSLAFRRIRSEHLQDLWVVDLATGVERRLTTDNQRILGLDWSPDGRDVLFASRRTGRWEMWRVAATGGPPRAVPILDRHVTDVTTTADGTIVYAHTEPTADLWTADLAPSASPGRPVLDSTRQETHPAVAPNGGSIAFASDRSGSYEIWRAAFDGSAAERLTDFGRGWVGSPRWSPDGRWIVFDARPDGQADVFRVEADGGRVQRLTDSEADDVTPAVAADGRTVYFASNRKDGWQIWRVAPDGGVPEPVTRNGGFSAQESVDGRLFVTRYDGPGIFELLDDGDSRMIADQSPLDWGNWQPVAGGIYYVLPGPRRLARLDLTTGASQEIVIPGLRIATDERGLAASADGRRIYYVEHGTPQGDLMRVDGIR